VVDLPERIDVGSEVRGVSKLESSLERTRLWCMVKPAALDGLRNQLSIEQAGKALDEKLELFSRAKERDEKIAELLEEIRFVKEWNPLVEVPRRADPDRP
jgi:hypothetical protein